MSFDPEKVFFGFHSETSQLFVDSPSPDDKVTCQCCHVAMPYSDWATHKATAKHQRCFEREVDLVSTEIELWKRRQEAVDFSRRIESLLLKEHQNVVNLKLLEYLTNVNVPLHTVEHELEQYEYMDHEHLLKLAIWKMSCITYQPGDGKTCGIRDAVEWYHWMSKGWKDFKEECRLSNRFAIICPQVLHYLSPKHYSNNTVHDVAAAEVRDAVSNTSSPANTPIAPFHDPQSVEHFVASTPTRPDFRLKCSRCRIEVKNQDWDFHVITGRHKFFDEQATNVNRVEKELWKRRCEAEQVMARRIATLSVEEHRNEAKLHLLRYISNLNELKSTLDIRLDKYAALESIALSAQLEGRGVYGRGGMSS